MPGTFESKQSTQLSSVLFKHEQKNQCGQYETGSTEYVERSGSCGERSHSPSGKKTQSSSTNENNNSGGVALSASHQLVNLQQKQQRNNNLVKNYHITEETIIQPISLYNNQSKPVAAVAPQQVLFEQPSTLKREKKRTSRKRSANDMSTGQYVNVSPTNEYKVKSPTTTTTTVIQSNQATPQTVQVVKLVTSACGNTFFVLPN